MTNNGKKKSVEDTITAEDVRIVAQRITNDDSVKVLDFQINAYSKDRLGFLGSHRNLEITLQRPNTINTEIINLFLKSIPYDCENQAEFMNEDGIFIKETAFFQTIIPLLMQNYECERWSPMCYLAKDDVLVMEDLRSQDFKLHGKFFDDTAILKSGLATLARFHGCSILAEAELNRHSQDLVTLGERYKDIVKEITFCREGKVTKFIANTIKIVVAIAESLGYRNSNKLCDAFEKMYDLVLPSKKHQNVICHGDLWTNNIMFDDTKPIPKCVLVDFQVIRYAPMVLDILQFIHLNTTREFRKNSEISLIGFYQSVLEEVIKNNDVKESIKVPTVNEILNGIKDFRLFGAIIAPLYFSIVLMDSEIVNEHTKDSERYENFLFGDRTELVMAHMEKNEFFKNKLVEAVTELLEVVEEL